MEKLKENLKKILNIQKVFIQAKKDNWQTFLDEIFKFDKLVLEKILNYYIWDIKVNKVRYDIVKEVLDWKKISLEDIENIKNIEQKKYWEKKIFRSWTYFSILHSIYFFDKKEFVNSFLEKLNKKLIKDLDLENKVKINIVDFTWAQNFWQDYFWTAIYNKTHKSQKTALQLNITSIDEENDEPFNDYKISIWLWNWPEVKENKNKNFQVFDIENLEYENILEIFEKNKKFILEDIKKENKQQFWLYAPGENAKFWNEFYKEWIMWIWWEELWDLSQYKTKEDLEKEYIKVFWKKAKNNILANWEFLNGLKKWDIVIAKNWVKEYIWYWIVEWDYKFDENREYYKSIRKIKWIKKWIWEEKWNIVKQIVLKTLTNITKYSDYVEELKKLLWIENNSNILQNNSFQMQKLLETSKKLLNRKKQIILYWPPWTWKTYNVKSIIEKHSWEKYEDLQKDEKVKFITFHQSFSYEEFIEGIKAETENWNINYKIKDWVFKELVEKANIWETTNFNEVYNKLLEKIEENDWLLKLKTKTWKTFAISINSNNSLNLHTWKDLKKQGSLTKENLKQQAEFWKNIFEYWISYFEWVINYLKENLWYKIIKQKTKAKNYYLIIDEINRWNISKIFGELITLLEADKRIGEENQLSTILPYSKEEFSIPENLYIVATMNTSDKSIVSLDTALRRRFGFVEILPKYDFEEWEENIEGIKLWKLLEKLNDRIEYLLDKDHLIGHSYFLKVKDIQGLKLAIFNEIFPLLEEYFYWEEENIVKVLWSKLFTELKINTRLFEKNNDIEDNEVKYKFRKELLEEENDNIFIEAIKNILDN